MSDKKTERPSRKNGYSQSPLTRVAAAHNWSKLQIKGATGAMLNTLAKHGRDAEKSVNLARRIHELERELKVLVEESYDLSKAELATARANFVTKYGEGW